MSQSVTPHPTDLTASPSSSPHPSAERAPDAGSPDRLVLVGFSGAGKTTVGRAVADALGRELVDLDDAIAAHYGADIPTIFASHGEAAFRATEQALLRDALAGRRRVVVTGGGAVAAEAAWSAEALAAPGVLVVALDVRADTTWNRLRRQQAAEGATTARPMLAGDDPLARMAALKAARQASYDHAHLTLVTDAVPPETVADEVLQAVRVAARQPSHEQEVRLSLPGATSRITVATGLLAGAGPRVRGAFPKARRAWVITDRHVGERYAEGLRADLAAAGLPADVFTVDPGEGSKSVATAAACWDWLLVGGVERGDVVVALGGGVIGDLAGFVAATTLRGVGLVQIPTSLLAMVDSSVGGKTGINHATGKNLIGAFFQPPVVLIDPAVLTSLPEREFISGWAEIIKHAIIQRSTPGGERGDLWTFLERNAAGLLDRRDPALSYLIARNVRLKAAVVEADEREAGLRQILNFGHTLGHAIEADAYRYLHGEAVALGMRAAARIGRSLGTCDDALVARLDATLDRFGLPARAEVDPERVLRLTAGDKKRTAGVQRWILPLTVGGVVIRGDVPEAVVRAALGAIVAGL